MDQRQVTFSGPKTGGETGRNEFLKGSKRYRRTKKDRFRMSVTL